MFKGSVCEELSRFFSNCGRPGAAQLLPGGLVAVTSGDGPRAVGLDKHSTCLLGRRRLG